MSKILIVDDEPEIVEYLSLYLTEQGFNCVGVTSVEDGVKLAESERFLAIITDYLMPHLTGLDLVVTVRKTDLNARTPFVVLSGALTDDLLVKLAKHGIIDVMSKPPDLDILVRVLQKNLAPVKDFKNQSYKKELVDVIFKTFVNTANEYIDSKIEVLEVSALDHTDIKIEFCSLVTLFGRKVSGMMAISFAEGFTHELAKTVSGRNVSHGELAIFETSTGEMLSSLTTALKSKLKENFGVLLLASDPIVIQGRYAPIPMPAENPRLRFSAMLNGERCFLEIAFIDLDERFKGQKDHENNEFLFSSDSK